MVDTRSRWYRMRNCIFCFGINHCEEDRLFELLLFPNESIQKRKSDTKMMTRIKQILAVFNYPRTLPVYLCALCSKQRKLIEMDVARWNTIDGLHYGFFKSLNWYMTYKKEFRNLIQHRFKHPSDSLISKIQFLIARIFWKPMDTLYIYTKDIGGGLYIQHGFATIISAKKIGENCRIYQQVTIGYKDENHLDFQGWCDDLYIFNISRNYSFGIRFCKRADLLFCIILMERNNNLDSVQYLVYNVAKKKFVFI